ncbi:ATP-binding protein, partial [Arsenicicoccus bolidensis]
PVTLGRAEIDRVRESTRRLAQGIGVRGLMNVQFALAQDILYVLEANPRASRTVPFVAKATGVQVAKAAARIMMGATIASLRTEGLLPVQGDGASLPIEAGTAVKEAVLPFKRFVTQDGEFVDTILGPEMRSTGEVMGLADDFGTAFAKSQLAAFGGLPTQGTVFISVANRHKRAMIFPCKRLADLGFRILATEGTADVLRRNGVRAEAVRKHSEGRGPDGEPTIVDLILAGEVDMVVNTPTSQEARADGYTIRTATTSMDKPIITTVQQLAAAVQGIEALGDKVVRVMSLQEHAERLARHGAHAAE